MFSLKNHFIGDAVIQSYTEICDYQYYRLINFYFFNVTRM